MADLDEAMHLNFLKKCTNQKLCKENCKGGNHLTSLIKINAKKVNYAKKLRSNILGF